MARDFWFKVYLKPESVNPEPMPKGTCALIFCTSALLEVLIYELLPMHILTVQVHAPFGTGCNSTPKCQRVESDTVHGAAAPFRGAL